MALAKLLAAPPHQSQSNSTTDRMDAAEALLGVSPANESASAADSSMGQASSPQHGFHVVAHRSMSERAEERGSTWDASLVRLGKDSSRVNGGALSALAALASSAARVAPSNDDDKEAMPPPPPRRVGRIRSASNPEGMEKWDSLNRYKVNDRKHFVLPYSILEEELASTEAAISSSKADAIMSGAPAPSPSINVPLKKREKVPGKKVEDGVFSPDALGTSPDSVITPMKVEEPEEEPAEEDASSSADIVSDDATDSPKDEADMEPAELLKRARSRLLEDLSESSMNGEKGVLTLPHSLAKYKEVYNKNGRIGIYTPAERAAIIARFNSKRSRRVWNKKIRYNCRKNLADRRMRVKGRFVKRSTEQAAVMTSSEVPADERMGSDSSSPTDSPPASRPLSPPGGPLPPVNEMESEQCDEDVPPKDHDMPDVNDVEAGFDPTEDQPYRRTRRHTIT